MNGFIMTKHFNARFQQRGIKKMVVSALLSYGERWKSHHGVDSIVLTKTALKEIERDLDRSVFLACDKLRNTYIVVTDEGVLITVARSHRRTFH